MSNKTNLPPLTLVLGGQRSGKSAYGESLIDAQGLGGIYIATADINISKTDDEMMSRINAHKARRGPKWDTVEETLDIKSSLKKFDKTKPVLLDSLGMWVANMIEAGSYIEDEIEHTVDVLFSHPAPVVVISEEVGLGIIPDNSIGRSFIDTLGALNQSIAAKAQNVVLCVAGIPIVIKKKEQ